MRKKNMNLTYKDSGVDIDTADKLVDYLKKINPSIGGFGGYFELLPHIKNMCEPILVSSTDGVGTKLLIAKKLGKLNTIGIDLVAMCVNDIITCGAKPLFFLDYYATGKLNLSESKEIIKGIVEGCRQSNISLVGGETAELPGLYVTGDFDLAGFAVGIADKRKIIDGKNIKPGDVIIGLKSNGIHSNGYSLVRKIIEFAKLDLNKKYFSNLTLGEELLKPTKIYVKEVMQLLNNNINVKGIAHITGGGIAGNLIRILPDNVAAKIEKNKIPLLPIFDFFKEKGNISTKEMFKVFNMGIGLIIIVTKTDLTKIPFEYHIIGEIYPSSERKVELL